MLGNSTFSGGVTLNSGTLGLAVNDNAMGTGTLTINGGSIEASNNGVRNYANDIVVAGDFSLLLGAEVNVATFSGTVDLGGAVRTITATSSRFGFSGEISNGGLIKTGVGVLTLGGVNTYTGGTTIQNGTLVLGAGATLGAASGAITSTGGTLNLGANNLTAGTVTIVGGTITNGGLTATSYDGQGGTVSANLGGVGVALTKTTDNLLMLSGVNTYSGGTTVSAGALGLGSRAAQPGTGTINVGVGAALVLTVDAFDFVNYFDELDLDALWANTMGGVTMDAGAYVGIDTSRGDFTYGTSRSTRGLVKTGANILTLSAANTYAGGTMIAGGAIKMGVAGAIGDNTAVILQGGSLDLNGNALTVSSLSSTSGSVTNSNALTIDQASDTSLAATTLVGAGSVTKTGAGALTLDGANSTFTGNFILQNGLLRVNNNSAVGGAAGTLTVEGGTISVVGITTRTVNTPFSLAGNVTLGSAVDGVLTLSGAGTLAGTYAITVPTGSTNNISGIIGDGGNGYGIVKQGGGRLYLQGENTFDGGITVEEGQLAINAGTRLGSAVGGTVIKNGAVLRIQANATIDDALTLTGSGEGAAGNNFGAVVMNVNAGTWTLNGAITLDGGAALNTFNSNSATVTIANGIAGTGNLELRASAANNGNGTYFLQGASSYTGDTILSTLNAHSNTVVLGVNNALPVTTVVRLQAPSQATPKPTVTLTLNGFNQEIAGLAAAAIEVNSTNRVVGGSATLSTLTVNNAADFTYGGRLGDSRPDEDNLALVKKGAGILTLSFDNTYTGATTIEGGTLAIRNPFRRRTDHDQDRRHAGRRRNGRQRHGRIRRIHQSGQQRGRVDARRSDARRRLDAEIRTRRFGRRQLRPPECGEPVEGDRKRMDARFPQYGLLGDVHAHDVFGRERFPGGRFCRHRPEGRAFGRFP